MSSNAEEFDVFCLALFKDLGEIFYFKNKESSGEKSFTVFPPQICKYGRF